MEHCEPWPEQHQTTTKNDEDDEQQMREDDSVSQQAIAHGLAASFPSAQKLSVKPRIIRRAFLVGRPRRSLPGTGARRRASCCAKRRARLSSVSS